MSRLGGIPGLLLTLAILVSGCVGGDASSNDDQTQKPSSVVAASGEPLPDAGSIVGTVTDETLSPIQGAQVAILDLEIVALTNEAGLFEFTNLAPANYRVAAAALGYSSAAKSVQVLANEETATSFMLEKIELVETWLEVIGPFAMYFDVRVGTPVVTGGAGPSDVASKNFSMTDDVTDIVGEMRWSSGSFATSKALRLSFSYSARTSTHWYCSATSPSPVQWHYSLSTAVEDGPEAGCQSPPYCGIRNYQGGGASEPKLPNATQRLITYTNTPFGCTSGDPTHAVEIALQQKLEGMLSLFHGGGKPETYTAFPDR